MSHVAESTAAFAVTPTPSPRQGVLERFRRHFARLATAHAGQARLAAIRPETLCDTGLSPDDLTGVPSHDPALPFFMQSRFGRGDR